MYFNILILGSGASTALIEDTAKAGNGKCDFVIKNEEINGKVIGLLKASLNRKFTKFEIEV
jgi:hypothetical protein